MARSLVDTKYQMWKRRTDSAMRELKRRERRVKKLRAALLAAKKRVAQQKRRTLLLYDNYQSWASVKEFDRKGGV